MESKKKDYAQAPLHNVQTATRNHPVSIQGIPWKLFNNESLRLVTYVKYPERGQKSALLLTTNGFVYTGEGNDNDDRVTCYSCCSTKQDWHLLDDVAEIHRQMSPGCSMVTHINSDNIPISTVAVTSFDNLLRKVTNTLPFHQQNVETNNVPVQNIQNNQNLTARTTRGMDKEKQCDPAQNIQYRSKQQRLTYSELGIITERPKRPEYATKSKRLKTFKGLPDNHHLDKLELVDAGFYYAGPGDGVRCFYCDGRLRKWEDGKKAWIEHARHFPKCLYVCQIKGEEFVNAVHQGSMEQVKQMLKFRKERLKQEPAVKLLVESGYPLHDVIAAAKKVSEHGCSLSSDVILDILEDSATQRDGTLEFPQAASGDSHNDNQTLASLREQNKRLRQQTVCKICQKDEVAVVFLPCGHLSACFDCASARTHCPVCCKSVHGSVRAFIQK